MNDLNLPRQGKNINILNCYEKLYSFKDKLSLWYRGVNRENCYNFISLGDIVDDNEFSSLIPSVCEELWLM